MQVLGGVAGALLGAHARLAHRGHHMLGSAGRRFRLPSATVCRGPMAVLSLVWLHSTLPPAPADNPPEIEAVNVRGQSVAQLAAQAMDRQDVQSYQWEAAEQEQEWQGERQRQRSPSLQPDAWDWLVGVGGWWQEESGGVSLTELRPKCCSLECYAVLFKVGGGAEHMARAAHSAPDHPPASPPPALALPPYRPCTCAAARLVARSSACRTS